MTRSSRSLARRYARALLEVASPDGTDAVLALRDELRAFAPVAGHHEVVRALRHPGLGAEARGRLLDALADRAGASPRLRRLVGVLAARDRLALLPEAAEAYAELANASHGVVSAEATSALPLDGEQRRALAAALGASVDLRTRVDAGILGGVVVRVGGRTYDGTVRSRLAALKRRLAAGA